MQMIQMFEGRSDEPTQEAVIEEADELIMQQVFIRIRDMVRGQGDGHSVGDVSWVVPTVQAHCSTYAIGTPGHSWQLTAQGKTPAAKKGMVHVAKVMAATAAQAIEDKTLIERAKADLVARTKERPYVSPIPADARPPLDMAAA